MQVSRRRLLSKMLSPSNEGQASQRGSKTDYTQNDRCVDTSHAIDPWSGDTLANDPDDERTR